MKDCQFFFDEDGTKEWANIAEFCTAKWMGILISHRTNRFDKLNHQVKTTVEEIIGHLVPIPLTWLEVLKKNTKRDEDNLIKMKICKFKCDLDDYNSDRNFTWNYLYLQPLLIPHRIRECMAFHFQITLPLS